ncbi:MAG: LytR/AlgR family response regulator transcription factor [Gemmatimonas sp.]
MNKLRVVIADDEPIARRGLLRMLTAAHDLELVGEAGDGTQALELIRNERPDVAFLDVQMPGGTGLDVARALSASERPAIVFVTAFDRFAIDAFDVHAVDYLLKPFDQERLLLALERVRERITSHANREAAHNATLLNMRLDAVLSALGSSRAPATDTPTVASAIGASSATPKDVLVVRDGERVILVPLHELDWCEAADNYVRLHVRARKHLVRETMRNLEERLLALDHPQAKFARIHRSTVVNLARVREIKPAGGGEYSVHLADGTKLVLSRSYRDRVLAQLGVVATA